MKELSVIPLLKFSEGIKNKNLAMLSTVLSEQGIYEIQNPDLSTQATGKEEFLRWISSCLDASDIQSVSYDTCTDCKLGNNVVLFNNGAFPRQIKDLSEKSKTGLMLDIRDGIIAQVKFCFSFERTENKPMFQCMGEEIKKLMSSGFSYEDAYGIVLKGVPEK